MQTEASCLVDAGHTHPRVTQRTELLPPPPTRDRGRDRSPHLPVGLSENLQRVIVIVVDMSARWATGFPGPRGPPNPGLGGDASHGHDGQVQRAQLGCGHLCAQNTPEIRVGVWSGKFREAEAAGRPAQVETPLSTSAWKEDASSCVPDADPGGAQRPASGASPARTCPPLPARRTCSALGLKQRHLVDQVSQEIP